MINYAKYVCVICVMLVTDILGAHIDVNLNQKIKDILSKRANIRASVLFYDLKNNKVIAEYNPELTLIPASLTKLVTTAAALDLWGPNKKFKTKIYYNGTIANNILNGDLIIVGEGDPFVVSEKLWPLSYDIYNLGIHYIKGNIIIDNSLFNLPKQSEYRFKGRGFSKNAYDAPISAFGVNFNTYAVMIAPSTKVGELAQVAMDPFVIGDIQIKNNVITSKDEDIDVIDVQRYSINGKVVISVSGKISVNSRIKKVYRSVEDPVRACGEYLKAFLQKAGIRISGNIKEGKFNPRTDKLLIELEGYDLRTILIGLNHYSNNYIADMLINRLGVDFDKQYSKKNIGSYESGIEALEAFLKNKVKLKTSFVIKDGSGLNVENKLSAAQIVQLLTFIAKDFAMYPNFLLTLAKPKEEGTFKKRLVHLENNLYIKTGTLSVPVSITGLAGFLYKNDSTMVAFCIILNGDPSKKQPSIFELRNIEDELLNNIFNII